MVKGLYTSSEGMITLMTKQDQISNNLANIATTGYKKSKQLVRTFSSFLPNDLKQPFVGNTTQIDEVYTDYSQGSLKQTENPLDLALEGDAFFTVETAGGRRYSRNGNFSVDSDGRLVTGEGNVVLGRIGNKQFEEPLIVGNKDISITADGNVSSGSEIIGKLRIVSFNKPISLDKVGNSLYKTHNSMVSELEATNYKIHQGFLETSNADPIESMVEMIATFRNYEANQKAIYAQDDTLGKAINDVGKINS